MDETVSAPTETAWIVDEAPGELRRARIAGGRIVEIVLARASWRGRRATLGERYDARITAVDPRRRGAFVDLGLTEDTGFLPIDGAGRARSADGGKVAVREGEAVRVRVVREAARGKGPVLALDAADAAPSFAAPVARRPYDATARADIEAAVDLALARVVAIPGGGRLAIEPTAALVAIDVDAEGRAGSADAERFVLDLNLAACREAFAQLRLRALGGLVAIDFVSLRTPGYRTRLEAEAKACAKAFGVPVELAPLSRFGVLEAAVGQERTPLHEIVSGPDGRPSPETVALDGLRRLESEGRANPGARLALTLPSPAAAWLDTAPFDAAEEMVRRLGARFTWTAGDARNDRCDVRIL